MTYTFKRDGAPQIDARNNVYYMAAGNSPAMMEKNVGQGSQYLWTYRDADGNFLDGAKTYTLHILPNIPAEQLLVGRRLRRAQPVGAAERPAVPLGQQLHQADRQCGRLDRHRVRARRAEGEGQLDQDGPGQGLVPDLPLLWPRGRPYFDKTWKLEDIVALK